MNPLRKPQQVEALIATVVGQVSAHGFSSLAAAVDYAEEIVREVYSRGHRDDHEVFDPAELPSPLPPGALEVDIAWSQNQVGTDKRKSITVSWAEPEPREGTLNPGQQQILLGQIVLAVERFADVHGPGLHVLYDIDDVNGASD